MSLYIRNKHRFFLDNTIKLVHVNPVRHGGEGGRGVEFTVEQQKLNLLVIYCFLYFKYIND